MFAAFQLFLKFAGALLEGGHGFLCPLGRFFVPLFHVLADCGGKFLQLRCVAVGFLLQTASLGIGLDYSGYDITAVESFHGQTPDHELGIGFYSL